MTPTTQVEETRSMTLDPWASVPHSVKVRPWTDPVSPTMAMEELADVFDEGGRELIREVEGIDFCRMMACATSTPLSWWTDYKEQQS